MTQAATNHQPAADRLLESIAGAFDLPAPVDKVEPHGRGLINDTYRVSAGDRRYLLQRINARVFPDPPRIMANHQTLARHARSAPDPGVRIPMLLLTHRGAPWARDPAGGYWRMMEFIEDTLTLNELGDADQAREVGRLLGCFHTLIQSLPLDQLGIALPGFHDTPAYLDRFMANLPRVDGEPSDPLLAETIDCVLARRSLATRLADAHARGGIPTRVTHGDPKLDNILFDPAGQGIALIDLDTLQPGLVLHDIGDCLRSCCNRGGESAPGRVALDLTLAAPLLEGYASQTRAWLTRAEVDLIEAAIWLMPFELGLRFLTDHLEGDRYFKVSAPGQNLRKAAIQLALVRDIESQSAAIGALVEACFRG
ncbi:MAG: aminoglycoside phosphotransferase family protein [Sphingobacteriia bacterium]|nr:aminoglycoside phosphotransferase family protein [Sphingobacteriia bacterium]NCC38076.1 aminoglycoside phosphotransferase family protein [Gammaproteobacteria bacterium]